MLTSRQIKIIARNKLRGNWKPSVWIAFLAVLLGEEYFPNLLKEFPRFTEKAELFRMPAIWDVIRGGSVLITHKAQAILDFYGWNISASAIAGIIAFFVAINVILMIINGPLNLGYKKYYIDFVSKNQADSPKVLFSRFGIFFKAIGLQLYILFFQLLWSLLLIIPGIVAGYRYSMAPYIMAENPDISIREAVEMSKQMMAGHKARLFWLRLSFIGWDFLALIPLGLGFLWLNPFIKTAEAVFYQERTGRGIPKAEPAQ